MGLWQTPTSIRMAPARTGGYVAQASYMTVMVGANSRGSSIAQSVGFLNRRLEVGVLPAGQIPNFRDPSTTE